MKNKKNIVLTAGIVILILISFYAGTKFNISNNSTQISKNINGMRGQAGGQFSMGIRGNGGNVFGKIIAKDANSVTIEIGNFGPNNTGDKNTQTGSKIVFYTDKTTISKTTNGNMGDLSIGNNVSISGSANPDGSVSAQSIQIR